MRKSRMKRFTALLTTLIMAITMIVTFGIAYAADSYYPGPEVPPDEPVVLETPTTAPTDAPKPSDTPVPATPTPEPAPATPTPEPKFPKADPTPSPTPAPELYTLTIYYKYSDGSQAAIPYVEELYEGASFDVQSPRISGYNITRTKVDGVMKDRELSFVVYYYRAEQYVGIEDYDTPLGLGSTVINIGDCFE